MIDFQALEQKAQIRRDALDLLWDFLNRAIHEGKHSLASEIYSRMSGIYASRGLLLKNAAKVYNQGAQ